MSRPFICFIGPYRRCRTRCPARLPVKPNEQLAVALGGAGLAAALLPRRAGRAWRASSTTLLIIMFMSWRPHADDHPVASFRRVEHARSVAVPPVRTSENACGVTVHSAPLTKVAIAACVIEHVHPRRRRSASPAYR